MKFRFEYYMFNDNIQKVNYNFFIFFQVKKQYSDAFRLFF